MSRGRNISLVLISIPSLVETFNRVTRRVPHVEQELLILPEHPSFWAIKKLCSFSWTFPENSRQPGGFYFYMMFMIPEVLVNFAMKNLLIIWKEKPPGCLEFSGKVHEKLQSFLIAKKLGCSGRIRSSCSTCGTRHVTRLKVSIREGIEIKTKKIFRPWDIKEIRRIKGV